MQMRNRALLSRCNSGNLSLEGKRGGSDPIPPVINALAVWSFVNRIVETTSFVSKLMGPLDQ